MNDRFPKCYTVEAIVRNHTFEPFNGSLTVVELERVLNQMVKDRRGHLQLQPLRSWAGGRYMRELLFEKQFLLEIFGPDILPDDHTESGDSEDFTDFGISF